jgi:drug/metabolite transporter (DMT)-like permease
VTRRYAPLLLVLAALWGASYLFIKVAVDEIEPSTLMAARLVIAALFVLPLVLAQRGPGRGLREIAGAWKPGLVLGILNAALPFTLVAWGEKHIDSGVAAVANATVPIFVAVLAIRFRPSERASGLRALGILIGIGGVAVLAGGQPDVGFWPVLGTLAVVAGALSFAVAGLYAQLRVARAGGPVLAAASMLWGALVLLPAGVVQAPHSLPSWEAIASVLALSIGGTAVGMVIMFRLLRLHGAARTSLVTYLMPLTAILYGAVFLDEPVAVGVIVGLVLILLGVALGAGGVRLARRERREVAPQL